MTPQLFYTPGMVGSFLLALLHVRGGAGTVGAKPDNGCSIAEEAAIVVSLSALTPPRAVLAPSDRWGDKRHCASPD